MVEKIVEMLRDRVGTAFDDEATFTGEEVEEIVAALQSAADTPPSPYAQARVKPLDWKPAALHHPYGLVVLIALTPFGPYQILKGSQGRFEVYFGSILLSGSMDDKDAATAFAQADWEKHILSSLAATAPEDGR